MLLLYIILATSLVSAISFVGIFTVFKHIDVRPQLLKVIISVAAGALLAVSFLELLPEAVEGLGKAEPVFVTTLISLLLFFILERFWHWHHCRCVDCGPEDPRTKTHLVYTNLIGDGIHNLTDGFLIATAFMVDIKVGIVTTFVVMLHEIPQEIADFGVLIYAGLSKAKALFFNFVFALTAIIGSVVFYFFGQQFANLIPYMAAFAAGNFIYLATADLIPELHHEKDPRRVMSHTFWLLFGVLIIFLINTLTSRI